MTVLPPKLSGETRSYEVDFGDKLLSGTTITSQSVTATTYSGTDASPSSIISGSASLVGTTIVRQTFAAGTAGVMYKLLWQAGTSDSKTLQKETFLAVITQAV